MHLRRPLALALLFGSALLVLDPGRTGQAQSLPALTPQDSTQWETLVPTSPHLGLSPDGSVLAYRIDRSNWDDELRITRLSDNRTLVVRFGREPEYSSDGRWLMYTIGLSPDEEAQLKRDRRSVRDGLGLLQLSTFTETRFAEVESAAFSADGTFIAMERYAGTAAGGRARGTRRSDRDPLRLYVGALGGDGAETPFDHIQQFAWQPARGHRLAMHMAGGNQGGNRIQLFDPSSPGASATTVVDDSAANFSRLSWRPDGADLAYLRGHEAAADNAGSYEEVVVVRGAGEGPAALTVYNAARDATFPAATRIVDFRDLSWSSDGAIVFVGIADIEAAQIRRAANGADVRIWHWTDVQVMPRQVKNIDSSLRHSRLAAVNIASGHLVPIALSLNARAVPIPGTSLAWVAEWTRYAMQRTLGHLSADLSLVNTRTGQRVSFAENVDEGDVTVRPDGGALVFLRNDHLWSLNTSTRALTDLSAASGAALVDLASDDTAAHKPLFGVGGWAADGAVLAYDRHDIWRIPVNGSGARKLTDGAATETRHRLARLDDAAPGRVFDLAAPVYIELFGERTKQSGYARRSPAGAIERLLFEDRHIDSLAVSADHRNYAYIAMSFEASPNIYIGSDALTDARAFTATNPQQAKFAWGHSAVIDYTTPHGDQLQAALYYPAGYVPGRRYPTIVKLYERLSDEVHDYVSPSDMDEANIAIFTGLGYAVIAPDIRYRPREPGVATAECVTAAVARAVAIGVTDAARVGVIGHSWGAYGSAFLATHTTGVFAAAVAGAAITDLISQAGNHHWGTGVAETDHIETGQQRMQVPFYDDVDAYVRNSPIFGVPKMATPLLLEAGDEDGDVFWHQSVELYNAARRANKPVVLLQYPGEDHALDSFDNRRDYQRRILSWFGHYLKGDMAPRWITTGTPPVKK